MPLINIVKHGNLQLIKVVIGECGANPNASMNIEKLHPKYIIHFAIDRGDPEIVRTLLEFGADPCVSIQVTRKGPQMNILQYACHNHSGAKALEVFKVLLEQKSLRDGKYVNAIAEQGSNESLLQYAIKNTCYGQAAELIKAGADVNALNVNCQSPLHYCAIFEPLEDSYRNEGMGSVARKALLDLLIEKNTAHDAKDVHGMAFMDYFGIPEKKERIAKAGITW